MGKLYALKSIFFEKQNSVDFKATLERYLAEACKPKGALLLALARGKISEGLDFSD
jgi:Rad3-related DNA helicase